MVDPPYLVPVTRIAFCISILSFHEEFAAIRRIISTFHAGSEAGAENTPKVRFSLRDGDPKAGRRGR